MIGNFTARTMPVSALRRVGTLSAIIWPWSAINQERQRADSMQRLLSSATDAAIARGLELNVVLRELDQANKTLATQKTEIALLSNENDAKAAQCRQMQKSIAAAIARCNDGLFKLSPKIPLKP